jgi:hypothetical protein
MVSPVPTDVSSTCRQVCGDSMTDHTGVDRRTVLGALATAGLGSVAGCSSLQGGSDGGSEESTTPVEPDVAAELAARFAPTLYFDEYEQWFPTDPRPYQSERDGETVVDGFDAFDGYHSRKRETGSQAPDPTVFYNVVQYEDSPLLGVRPVYDQLPLARLGSLPRLRRHR